MADKRAIQSEQPEPPEQPGPAEPAEATEPGDVPQDADDYTNPSGRRPARQRLWMRGNELLTQPFVNRGTAFTREERQELGIIGLLPAGEIPMDGQVRRVYAQYRAQGDDLAKNVYLQTLRDRNETLFYRLLQEHLEEMMPIVYTPTIGEAIEKFSHWYSRPRGVFLSIDHPEDIETAFDNYGAGPDEVDLLVATDSEGILGIGDQGVGGIMIAIGKLSVYTAAGGIHPRRAIPVVLDVGTDNLGLLNDEFYLGARHARVRGERYDEFIRTFVEVVSRRFPHAMIHWEDFGAGNAHRILAAYRDEACTFNDDIQGTAAVVLAAAISATRSTATMLRDQRIVVFGAGTAGMGIADYIRNEMVRQGVPRDETTDRFWCVDRYGLISDRMGGEIRDFQRPYSRPASEVDSWEVLDPRHVSLLEVVRNVKPTILIGTSAQGGAFTEEIVGEMARHTPRPIIFPLSNPTSRAEATPADILRWTDGEALVATGSPFDTVYLKDVAYEIAQANNALVFPGIGLGVTVCRPTRITDRMIAAAAEAVGEIGAAGGRGSSLLPSMSKVRMVSGAVAIKVCEAAEEDGVARVRVSDKVQEVFDHMWQPTYRPIDI